MGKSVSVAVIGSGVSGIAAAVQLKKAGVANFVVFEKSDGPGGTWWENTYPGCAVDVPSNAYSYSFFPYDWSRTHARQEEVQGYLQRTIDTFGIADRFKFSTEITSVEWQEPAQSYIVTDSHGDASTFDLVISCVGLLNQPNYPRWPGLESFEGPVFHTSRWNHELDLSNKRVAFVGTGSTGAQVVPAIAPDVEHLDVYQREPGWILPKPDRVFDEADRQRFNRFPLLRRIDRLKFFRDYARAVKALDVASDKQDEMRRTALSYIATAVHDESDRIAVTPTYPFGCKRTVFSNDFYPAINRSNVSLRPRAVSSVTAKGVIDDQGVERETDVLILGTGFQPTRILDSLEVVGCDGQVLADTWGESKPAFLGMTVSGFPNFFIMYGPNTNAGSIMALAEWQAKAVARTVRRMSRRGMSRIDTPRHTISRYVAWVDNRLSKYTKAQDAGCNNYFHATNGRNVTQWPGNPGVYWAATKVLPRLGFAMSRPTKKSMADEFHAGSNSASNNVYGTDNGGLQREAP